MRTHKLLCGAALAPVLLASLATAAHAQEDATADRSVEEIVVTAQKREQRLQDVPIVVTSVSGQLMRDAGVRDIRELTVLTPGLTVTSTTSGANRVNSSHHAAVSPLAAARSPKPQTAERTRALSSNGRSSTKYTPGEHRIHSPERTRRLATSLLMPTARAWARVSTPS